MNELYRTTLIKVRDHLLKQGKRCNELTGDIAPVNHNSQGLSCAIGCLQTKKINNVLPFVISSTDQQAVVDAEFRALGFTELDYNFLNELRRVHDFARNGVGFKDDVIGLSKALALKYELPI